MLEIKLQEIDKENELLKKEIENVLRSDTYRIAVKQKEVLQKLGLIRPLKGLVSVYKKNKRKVKGYSTNSLSTVGELHGGGGGVANDWQKSMECYLSTIDDDEDTILLSKIVKDNKKPIIVYFPAVPWEPLQRPQHFLIELSKRGYLCFFCDLSLEESVKEIHENLFLVKKPEALCKVLQALFVLVLVSWPGHLQYLNLLKYKKIWYDLLDAPDFFAGDPNQNLEGHKQLLSCCDLLTYSNKNLERDFINAPAYYSCFKHSKTRIEEITQISPVYIPNGVRVEDFQKKGSAALNSAIKDKIQALKKNSRILVGYVGAIESWLDWDCLKLISMRKGYEIVLVGPYREEDKKTAEKFSNIHLIGKVDYNQVPKILSLFDICIIPFKENKITKYVTPIKFFEYFAAEKPILSSNFSDIKGFQGDSIKFYSSLEDVPKFLDSFEKTHETKRDIRDLDTFNWAFLTEQIVENLQTSPQFFPVFSNFSCNSDTNSISYTFYNFEGEEYYSGGAERYLLDLALIHRNNGLTMRLYQFGTYHWVRFYGDLEVVGIPALPSFSGFRDVAKALDDEVSKEDRFTKLTIYSPFFINNRKKNLPSIGISHGVAWDNPESNFHTAEEFWRNDGIYLSSASNCSSLISVDTNTCNWFQTLNYEIGKSIKYLPNYVDLNVFKSGGEEARPSGQRIILYPRRLYSARGFDIVIEVMGRILADYGDVIFKFVGKGFEQDTYKLVRQIGKWGSDRIKWFSLAPDEMYRVYKDADITLIPTMYSEGTSLSCLEALASGNGVIATRIGGLTDLVIDGYNGLLIEPNADALEKAIRKLLDDEELLRKVKLNARETATCFSKEKWRLSWENVLEHYLPLTKPKSAKGDNREENKSKAVRRLLLKIEMSEINPQDPLPLFLKDKNLLKIVNSELRQGSYVFIVSQFSELIKCSFRRLQFISSEKILDFVPEETICYKLRL